MIGLVLAILFGLIGLVFGVVRFNPRRLYKSGTRWCFWRWTTTDSEYITRLHVLKTPWFALCVHWLNKPDPEPYLHDHPVTFLSVILRGGYTEKRMRVRTVWTPARDMQACRTRIVKNTWWNYIRASKHDRHTIIEVKPRTVTLCFMGPKTREWGFHQPWGWIHWKEYYAKQRAEKASS